MGLRQDEKGLCRAGAEKRNTPIVRSDHASFGRVSDSVAGHTGVVWVTTARCFQFTVRGTIDFGGADSPPDRHRGDRHGGGNRHGPSGVSSPDGGTGSDRRIYPGRESVFVVVHASPDAWHLHGFLSDRQADPSPKDSLFRAVPVPWLSVVHVVVRFPALQGAAKERAALNLSESSNRLFLLSSGAGRWAIFSSPVRGFLWNENFVSESLARPGAAVISPVFAPCNRLRLSRSVT